MVNEILGMLVALHIDRSSLSRSSVWCTPRRSTPLSASEAIAHAEACTSAQHHISVAACRMRVKVERVAQRAMVTSTVV